MASHQVGGYTKSGLRTAVLRDLDIAAPRAKLPPRALPDDVRARLGLASAPAPPAPAAPLRSVTTSTNKAAGTRPMFKA